MEHRGVLILEILFYTVDNAAASKPPGQTPRSRAAFYFRWFFHLSVSAVKKRYLSAFIDRRLRGRPVFSFIGRVWKPEARPRVGVIYTE